MKQEIIEKMAIAIYGSDENGFTYDTDVEANHEDCRIKSRAVYAAIEPYLTSYNQGFIDGFHKGKGFDPERLGICEPREIDAYARSLLPNPPKEE